MTRRWPVTLLALAGALTAGFSAQAGGSAVASLAWAVAAGLGLSLMLRGVPLRVLGTSLVVLAVASAGWAGQAGQWVALVGFLVALVGLLAMAWWGPGWVARPRTAGEHPVDLWKAMDEGADPTGEQDVHRAGPAG
ncbi:hypothetical protein [Tessaracoccus sp. Z1128]